MKKLDKFVLKSFTGPLILTFFIVLIILILQFLWMYVDELAGKGLEIKILAELLFNFSLSFVPTALPLAILLAALMTFGNMGEFSELTALKSSGIPLHRIMRPLIILIAFISVISFFFSNNVLPYANRKARTLLYDIRRKRPDINIQAGTFNNDIEGFSIKITSKDPETNRLDRLFIYDHRDNRGNTSVTYADSGYMRITPDETALIMVLYNGYSYTDLDEKNVTASERKYPFRKDIFKEQTIVLPLSGFDLERSEIDLFKSNSAMLNISQLTYFIDSLNNRYNTRVDIQLNEFNNTKLYTERYFAEKSHPERIAFSTKIQGGEKITLNARKAFDTLSIIDKRTVIGVAIQNLKDGSNYLMQKKESLQSEVRHIKRYEVDWHRKFTLSFACLVFFFIGAPLGAIIRKGGLGTPAVISILFFVVWYVISLSGEKLVEENLVSTFAGMWAASYILLPAGLFLTYKASTDSVIMNVDTYLAFFKKIKDYLYRIIIMGTRRNPAFENNITD
ncbi:MAG: YjgP/YjgQ family permease [Bacteroidales bacterium]|nr:YjgP/YjgQ family permease [Bacteroidales bacterium]